MPQREILIPKSDSGLNALAIETIILKNKWTLGFSPKVSFALILIIWIIFIITTFIQPDIPLFTDSATGKRGISK